MGFICKGCVRESVCEDSRQIEDWSVFAGSSRVSIPRSDWNTKSQDRMETVGFRECFTGKAFLQDTRKTFCFARLALLIYSILTHTIYTPITHICWGVLLRENPSHKPWELEIVIPTILYTITYGISSTPTSLFPYTWEVDSVNTYHTLSEFQVRFCYC